MWSVYKGYDLALWHLHKLEEKKRKFVILFFEKAKIFK